MPLCRVGVRHAQACVMCLCAAVLYMCRTSMSVALLAMTQHTYQQWDERTRGIILSAFFWGYTAMQVPAGVMGSMFGGKVMVLVALASNGIMCLATPYLACVGGWAAVCVVRALMGVSQACFMPCYHGMLGRWAPPNERTTLSALAYAGIQLGTVVAMPATGLLANTALGWPMIYYGMGALTLLAALLWATLGADGPATHARISAQERQYIETALQTDKQSCAGGIPWREMLSCPPLYAICAAHIGANWAFVFFLLEVPTYMKSGLGIDLTNSSTLSAVPFLAQWLFSIVSSVLCEYIYNKGYMSLGNTRKLFNTIGCVAMSGGLIAMSFMSAERRTLAVVLLTFTVGVFGCLCSGFLLNHIDLSPNFGGLMLSMTNCIANLFAILVPIVTGMVLGDHASDPSRWRIMFLVTGALLIIADVIYVVFSTSEVQRWNNKEQYEAGAITQVNTTDDAKQYEFTETKDII